MDWSTSRSALITDSMNQDKAPGKSATEDRDQRRRKLPVNSTIHLPFTRTVFPLPTLHFPSFFLVRTTFIHSLFISQTSSGYPTTTTSFPSHTSPTYQWCFPWYFLRSNSYLWFGLGRGHVWNDLSICYGQGYACCPCYLWPGASSEWDPGHGRRWQREAGMDDPVYIQGRRTICYLYLLRFWCARLRNLNSWMPDARFNACWRRHPSYM